MRLILPEDERVAIPNLLLFLAVLGPIVVLWLPPTTFRSLVCAALIISFFIIPGLVDSFGDTDTNAGSVGCVAIAAYHLIDRIYLSNTETDFQRILSEDSNGRMVFEQAPRPMTWKRFKWASELSITYRGIGWNWLVRNVPPTTRQRQSRIRFFVTWFGKGTLWFLLSDLLYLPMTGISYPLSLIRFNTMAPLTRAVFLLSIFWRIYGMLICPFYWIEAVLVLLGACEPTQCAPIFGSVTEAYSVRNFWNKVWHQGFRRPLSHLSHLFLNSLGLESNTLLYAVLHILIVFCITATCHAHVILLLGGSGIGQLKFFLLQALGVIAEMMLFTYTNIRIPRWLGYFTVAAWLYYTGPLYIEELLQNGNSAKPLDGMLVQNMVKWQGHDSYSEMMRVWVWHRGVSGS